MDRVAIVTGASRGVARATVISLARYLSVVPLAAATPEQDSSGMTLIVDTDADNAPGRNWGWLMAAAQAGDAKAYRMLLSELAVWLRQYYATRLPPAMTEDAVRDVLLAIHEKRHTYDPGHPFEPWLAAIARHKWIDRLRPLKSGAAQSSKPSVAPGSTAQRRAQNAFALATRLFEPAISTHSRKVSCHD